MKWRATLENGRVINQFTEEGETLYKEVEDNLSSVETFSILTKEGEYKAQVNLNNEIIKCDGKRMSVPNGSLVYKRRHKERYTMGGKRLKKEIIEIIGLENEEEKVLFFITPESTKMRTF